MIKRLIRKRKYKKRRITKSFVWEGLLIAAVFAFLLLTELYNLEQTGMSVNKEEVVHIAMMVVLALFFMVSTKALLKKLGRVQKNRKYLNYSYDAVDRMGGEQFEEFLASHFRKCGYKVSTTPKTGDYGVDLICRKNGNALQGELYAPIIAVQAKRYKGKVGVKAVQEIVSGMVYYDISCGLVATNSYFTQNARELAKKSKVLLWDRDKLAEIFQIKGENE